MTMKLCRREFLAASAALTIAPQSSGAAGTIGANAQDVANLGTPDIALETKISALASEAGLTKIGFAAVDLSKGRTAFIRGGELFPMQSVYKLPIAVAYLQMVQDGEARMDRKVVLTAADISPGRSPLAEKLRAKPTQFTASQLIDHVLLNSDNTATDALLKLSGGPARVQSVINAIGLEGVRIDRYERELQPQIFGLTPDPAYANAFAFETAIQSLDEAKQKKALELFLRDARDTASPRGIASLLFKLMGGHLLELRHVTIVLDLMRRTKTGEDRLNGGMLPGWTFAHRGGQSRTVNGTTAAFNDAGLATHKNGAKIIIVLFIEGATLSTAELAQFHRTTARAVLTAWG